MGLFDSVSSEIQSARHAVQKAGARSPIKTSAFDKLDSQLGSLESYLDGRIFEKYFPNSRFSKKSSYWTTPIPAFGGISPKEANKLFDEFSDIQFASRKLFLLEIKDLNPVAEIANILGNRNIFNLFATDVSYSPVTIPAEKKNIGTAVIDNVSTTEHVELNLTTKDDKHGTLKRWFDEKASRTASSDGTVGLPVDYLCKIRVLHSFFSDSTNKDGYENTFLMRPVSSEYQIGRSEGGLQEITFVFTQFDTNMGA